MASAKDMFDQALSIIKGMTLVQKLVALVLVAVVVGGLMSLTMTGSNLQYKVLFSGLNQEDAGEVVVRLKDMRQSYQLSEDGRAILVPADRVYEVRLELAGEGLPRGGGVGFEIFDKTSLGTTDFVQRLNYQRALQGELSRTIRQFQQVQEARVHLATPKESVFIEEQRPTSASVSVRMKGREKLSELQIRSIVNLVASAVPGLTTENITLVDTEGRLLYRQEGDESSLVTATQLEYQFKIENAMRRKVESMLEEVVGINRVKAQVTAEIDFSRSNMTEESFDPEGQVVRSEQQSLELDPAGGPDPAGIPGVKGNLASFAEGGEEMESRGGASRNNMTRNYEISRTTRHVQGSTGIVKRLSVAVMVDGTYEKAVDGEEGTSLQYQARTPEEMQFFEKLARNAIGFDAERGDQVEVVNMAFALSAIPEPKVDPLDKWRDLAERVAMPFFYLVISLLVLFFVIKPLLRVLATRPVAMQPVAAGGAMAVGGEGGGAGELEEDLSLAPKKLTDQERMFRLAQSDPDRAADLVKRWLREEQ